MTEATETTRRRTGKARAIIQIIGFGLSVALLVWCVRMVMSPENRESLENLRNATGGELFLLLGLASVSILVNGLAFWVVLKPVQTIRWTDLAATNALATFLAYLPFKISVITRVVIHRKRDGVPLMRIGAWLVAFAGLSVLTLAGMGVLFIPWIDGAGSWLLALMTIIILNGLAWVSAKALQGDAGTQRLRKLGMPERWVHSVWFDRFHDATAMVGFGPTVVGATILRVIDVASFGARFYIAARVLDLDLSPTDGMIIGIAYFTGGLLSPFGSIGTREASAIGLAIVAGVTAAETNRDAVVTAILLVSACEAIVALVGAGFGVAWLRADKLLLSRVTGEQPSEEAS